MGVAHWSLLARCGRIEVGGPWRGCPRAEGGCAAAKPHPSPTFGGYPVAPRRGLRPGAATSVLTSVHTDPARRANRATLVRRLLIGRWDGKGRLTCPPLDAARPRDDKSSTATPLRGP